jgi:integrase
MSQGSISEVGKGRWEVRYDEPTEAGRKQRSKTMRGTRKDAERFLRDVLTQLDKGTYVPPAKKTLEQYLLEEWLPKYCRKALGQATY